MMGDDPARVVEEMLPLIGHVQFADVPGRGEPGAGRLPLAALFAQLDHAGYAGWIAAEYRPSRKTEDTLAWIFGAEWVRRSTRGRLMVTGRWILCSPRIAPRARPRHHRGQAANARRRTRGYHHLSSRQRRSGVRTGPLNGRFSSPWARAQRSGVLTPQRLVPPSVPLLEADHVDGTASNGSRCRRRVAYDHANGFG